MAQYKIGQFAKIFFQKCKDIQEKENAIILQFCNPGELTVPQERVLDCEKIRIPFLVSTDTIDYTPLKIEWFSTFKTTENSKYLHSLIEEAV